MQHNLGGKGKDRVALIKSLIYMRVWMRHFEGHAIKIQRKSINLIENVS